LNEERQQELARRFPRLSVVTTGEDEERSKEAFRDADIAYGYVAPDWIREAKRLKVIQIPWHGVEIFSDPIYREKKIALVNCKPLCGVTMTEHAFMLIFALYRHFPDMLDWQGRREWVSKHLVMHTLPGKTLGLLGTGAIAQRSAEVGACMGCRIIGYNTRGGSKSPYETIYCGEELHDFLSQSDIVISTLPHTPKTQNLMNAAAFAVMKSSALFVNMGRGTTVDESALIEALKTGKIAGAGLDVTAKEPLPEDDPLWSAPNIIITPHRSGLTAEHHEIGFEVLCQNIERFLNDQPLLYVVDLERGY